MKTRFIRYFAGIIVILAVSCESKPTAQELDRQVRENPTAPPTQGVIPMPPESAPPPGGILSDDTKGTRSDYQPSTGPGGKQEERKGR